MYLCLHIRSLVGVSVLVGRVLSRSGNEAMCVLYLFYWNALQSFPVLMERLDNHRYEDDCKVGTVVTLQLIAQQTGTFFLNILQLKTR